MIDRTRSEDTEHEVVEEVLHVATTLRDMGRGENVRSSMGAGSADGNAYPRAVPTTSTRPNPMIAERLETPCVLRECCEGWKMGVDVRRGRVSRAG